MLNINEIRNAEMGGVKQDIKNTYPIFGQLTVGEQDVFLKKYPTEYESILKTANNPEDLRSFITTAEKIDNGEKLF